LIVVKRVIVRRNEEKIASRKDAEAQRRIEHTCPTVIQAGIRRIYAHLIPPDEWFGQALCVLTPIGG